MERRDVTELLLENDYPGRGILLGRSAGGNAAVAAYFITGRSDRSRDRRMVPTEDGVRTEPLDPSRVTDPSLIFYHPVRRVGRGLVVSNGDQTDTIRDSLLAGESFAVALHRRTFEPDAPHYTPRISGLLSPDGSYLLSILKRDSGGGCCRYFYRYDAPAPGEGRLICTYLGNGDPLPSFEGEPLRVSLTAEGPGSLADQIWAGLDPQKRVSLFVRWTALPDGACRDVLRNARER